MANKTELNWVSFGNGVQTATDGERAYFSVPLDKAKGHTSKSGKMVLVGDTGGFQTVPGDSGLRVNLSVGYRS